MKTARENVEEYANTVEPFLQEMVTEVLISQPADVKTHLVDYLAKTTGASACQPPRETLTIHYGNIPVWRAEVARLALMLGNVDFVDKRYAPYFGPEMYTQAKKFNAGQAPWITLSNGRVLGQTSAILRYCADISQLSSADPWECAKVDEIVNVATEITQGLKAALAISNPDHHQQRAARQVGSVTRATSKTSTKS